MISEITLLGCRLRVTEGKAHNRLNRGVVLTYTYYLFLYKKRFLISLSLRYFPIIAKILRGRGYDVVSAHEIGMIGKTDDEQLEFDSNEKRIIITFNAKHYASLARKYFFSKMVSTK
ncbi:MAG: DUF5615 family PIN-like protein [Nitrospinota bacterium]